MFEELQPQYEKPIVTEVKQFSVFYPAEEYHQDYFLFNPDSECAETMPAKLHALKDLLREF